MVGMSQRMNRMKARLMQVRVGPGAALLPKNVQRITLRFAPDIRGGHGGPKRFWRNIMPRLKYRNPAVQMIVDRTAKQDETATMTIHFASPSTSAPSPAKDTIPTGSTSGQTATSNHNATERVVTIDVLGRGDRSIFHELKEATKAKDIPPQDWELAEVKRLAEMAEKSTRDRARQAELRAQQKREEEMLRIARGEAGLDTA
ncbi:hypothetical protein K490DRAFT_54323 [Saccharata proteae CBS 121410]|uniref:Ribosomal protein/NADH dehydrogenase domain-containing protein n=1 Tax=Saccharata proteae CBS 121410 TaxID=1314787 RepID=A0A9P4M1F4_9PEZI|nr:hypothetical protein K490DRAFT_54323 [Saccharata proteae CBS 121410]